MRAAHPGYGGLPGPRFDVPTGKGINAMNVRCAMRITFSSLLLGSALALGALALPALGQSAKLANPAALNETAPATYKARFDTSKGVFVIDVHRDFAPLGADRVQKQVPGECGWSGEGSAPPRPRACGEGGVPGVKGFAFASPLDSPRPVTEARMSGAPSQ